MKTALATADRPGPHALVEVRAVDLLDTSGTSIYEVTYGTFIARYARRSSMQRHYVNPAEAHEAEESVDYVVDWDDQRTVSVTCDGGYIGHFDDLDAFLSFVKHNLRRAVVSVVED